VKTATILKDQGPWLHEAFLARAAEPGNEEGRHALGAFLTMRLADRFDPADEPAHPLALAYQVRATRDYLADLGPPNVETTHLVQVVQMADAVQRGSSRTILWPPLLAYASWLEQELQLGEALDVVETALRLNDGKAPTEEIAALLQRARILRLVGQLDEAKDSYEAARVKAVASCDTHSQLLGQIGQAIVMKQRGNLSGSAETLKKILADAEELGDQDAQARAHHDLGVACNSMGRGDEAIPHLYRAFELYDRWEYKVRALSDLGESLKRQGHYDGARDALEAVLARAKSTGVKSVAMIGLLELSGLTRDRVAFTRWRTRIKSLAEELPVWDQVDFDLQVGIAQAAFGQSRSAEQSLQRALAMAQEHGLNEHVFRAEAALHELNQRNTGGTPRRKDSPPVRHPEEVLQVAEKLHALAVA
jgi:tetratricopeptide (TPR) repeat protein